MSRRTAKEARINIKGCGYLHLFKSRELAYNFIDESSGGTLTDLKIADDIFRARNQEREDLSFIDGASAILSRGGGHSFAVKAAALSKLSTVTPPSNISVTSSTFGSKRH